MISRRGAHRREYIQRVWQLRRLLVQKTPRRQLARVGGEPTLQVSAHIVRGSLEGRNQAGLTGREGRIAREGRFGGRRARGGKAQLIQTLAEAVLEGHGGQVREGQAEPGQSTCQRSEHHGLQQSVDSGISAGIDCNAEQNRWEGTISWLGQGGGCDWRGAETAGGVSGGQKQGAERGL